LQLRIIIKNTLDVYLDDVNPITKERTSDIYVKGWIGDQYDKMEKTDTHFRYSSLVTFSKLKLLSFRSRTGEGNFNFRFIFDFDYLISENKIVIQDNRFLSFGKTERKVDPILHLEVWDADFLTADDFIGELQIKLSEFVIGSKTSRGCENFSHDRETFNLFQIQVFTLS
jgi:hypothetical protein